jgi:hypothetical protein
MVQLVSVSLVHVGVIDVQWKLSWGATFRVHDAKQCNARPTSAAYFHH